MAVRGKVYNVTHFMDFHPGGPDELLKGVGRDATQLYDKYHSWVNVDAFLGKCFIGYLIS
jgi:cytochrome-b5 reductase